MSCPPSAAPGWIRWRFRGAALYGIMVLPPLYLRPLPAAGPEWFYGFVGTALAFQLVYWTIGGDPVRYRPLMRLAVLAKLGFFVPCLSLFLSGRLGGTTMAAAGVDAVLAIGYAMAWRTTPQGLGSAESLGKIR